MREEDPERGAGVNALRKLLARLAVVAQEELIESLPAGGQVGDQEWFGERVANAFREDLEYALANPEPKHWILASTLPTYSIVATSCGAWVKADLPGQDWIGTTSRRVHTHQEIETLLESGEATVLRRGKTGAE